jgi:protein gp37
MSDLFHENVTDEMLDKIFAVMALCPRHMFQVLTKRPQRMFEYMASFSRKDMVNGAIWTQLGSSRGSKIEHGGSWRRPWPLPNVWLGVSVENQKAADERIPLLLQTPAAVRFISAEPLLSELDIRVWLKALPKKAGAARLVSGVAFDIADRILDWVICGGESGPGARPMYASWAQSLRDQCVAAGVPYFFKQWGEWLPAMQDGADNPAVQELNCSDQPIRVGKKAAGALLDGVEWKQFPEVALA